MWCLFAYVEVREQLVAVGFFSLSTMWKELNSGHQACQKALSIIEPSWRPSQGPILKYTRKLAHACNTNMQEAEVRLLLSLRPACKFQVGSRPAAWDCLQKHKTKQYTRAENIEVLPPVHCLSLWVQSSQWPIINQSNTKSYTNIFSSWILNKFLLVFTTLNKISHLITNMVV